MDKLTRKMINHELTVPFIITLIATLMMIVCVFLPYATATGKRAEQLEKHPDVVVFEKIDMTAKDIKDISMAEYAYIYYTMGDDMWLSSTTITICVALVGLIAGFSLIAALFTLGRKPIPVILFAGLAYGVFALQNWDYTDRGIIPSDSYSWGLGHTIFPIATAVVLIGAVWMLIRKIRAKREYRSLTIDQIGV